MGTIALTPNALNLTMTESIVERIQEILNRHDTVPQSLKDELILLGLAEMLNTVKDHGERLKFLEKYKPYLQAIAWAVGIVGVAIMSMAVTGRLQVTILP